MAGPVTEEVCVAAPGPDGAIAAARSAAPPRTVSRARGELLAGRPLGPLPWADLLAYLPPKTTNEAFEVRAAGAVDPGDPTHGWVVVEGVASLGRSDTPLRLTVMLSLADSMGSAPTAEIPLLQDAGPGAVRPVTRIALAKSVLDELVRRMPPRTEVSLVAFDRTSGRLLLPPTRATERERIREVIERVKPLGSEASLAPIEVAYQVAGDAFDPCADQRMLLVTDDRAVLGRNPEKTEAVVGSWAKKGVELWTVSLGLLGRDAPEVEALTVVGRGTHLYADTRSEAVEPLVAALRASGAVARDASIDVTFGPGVTAWRVPGGSEAVARDDRFGLPTTVEGGWREVRFYEIRRDPAVAGPLATVAWRAGSPLPGEWEVGDRLEVGAAALSAESPALLTERVFAARIAEQAASPTPDWAAARDFGASLQLGSGPAKELLVWTDLLAKKPR